MDETRRCDHCVALIPSGRRRRRCVQCDALCGACCWDPVTRTTKCHPAAAGTGRKRRRGDDERVRASGHTTWWDQKTGTLGLFIGEAPRDWPALNAWARERKHSGHMMGHMVAYLESQRRIRYEEQTKTWHGIKPRR